jgi:hypothetical protein
MVSASFDMNALSKRPSGGDLRRADCGAVLFGLFLVLAYYGLDEIHGEALLASLLVFIGSIAVPIAIAKVWPEPK